MRTCPPPPTGPSPPCSESATSTSRQPPRSWRKCAALRIEPAAAEHALALVAEVDGDAELRAGGRSEFAAEIGRLAERLAASIPARLRQAAAEQDRVGFLALWQGLKKLTPADWRLVVAAAPELAKFAFVKLLGEESARAASTDAKRALGLAQLALWVAERIEGEEGWVSRIFAWAYLGNARRVASDLPGGLEAFEVSARLCREKGPEAQSALPEVWRLLDLEASLRIDLRQPAAALHLLDQAVEAAPPTGSIRAHLLCIRSNALERLGDSEASLAALREGIRQIDREAEPRLLCMLLFNAMDSLCTLGQAAEAEGMLPELRRLQAEVGNGLNLIRLRWLEGKIAAGLGRIEEAIEALSAVRAAFDKDETRRDEALAGLELAGLYLQQGRTADVKRLVRQMEPVFLAQGIPVEARKALHLFRRAVEMETVTVELVQRIADYLRKAQDDPELPFEDAA